MAPIDTYLEDLSAFADDDDEVVIDADGGFAFTRAGEIIQGRLVANEPGSVDVVVDGDRMSYRTFLTHHVAHLDVLAERILAKREPDPSFIDGPARLLTTEVGSQESSGLQLLKTECLDLSPFATRIVFVTADAGHGKTVLLRQLQHEQAESFRNGASQHLIWHVDLQGRQLVRLSEALMGDLAELRVPGLWMPAVLRLMRLGAIILAVDGFDELAAEQGSTDALGALAMLVRDLHGSGAVIAASRRTFFDTEDYVARAGLLRRAVHSPTEFHQLGLLPWGREQGVRYLDHLAVDGKDLAQPERVYDDILNELGGEVGHPMLTRPFLFSRIARALLLYDISPSDFVRGMDDPMRGVAAVVQAFVHREVADKWKAADTGEPYLTVSQHMELLAAVAEEMYRAQRDRVSVDVLETIVTLLLDDWEIEHQRRQQVVQMVKMHVLLTVPVDGDASSRAFDHQEFRDYFVAVALRGRIAALSGGTTSSETARLLSMAQLSDSTARYVCGMLDVSNASASSIAGALAALARNEWKPTYLQTNVGTLLPFILDGREFDEPVEMQGPFVISSLVLEGSRLRKVRFTDVTLVRASLARADWTEVTFNNCALGEVTVDLDASYVDVQALNCTIDGVRLVKDGEEIEREYSPARIKAALARAGISLGEVYEQQELDAQLEDTELVKTARRFLRIFYRTTVASDHMIDNRFRQDRPAVYDVVIPLLENHGLVEEREWRGQGTKRIWALRCLLDELLAAEGSTSKSPMAAFWDELHSA